MLEPFLIIAAIAVIVVLFRGKILAFLALIAGTPEHAFVPDPESDKRVVVRGWTNDELHNILKAFAKMYELPESFVTQEHTGDSVLLSFPNDIPSHLLFFLVNYLVYPHSYDLESRDIVVVGKATLTEAFNPPDSSLVGQEARIYVPDQDSDFDLVYLTVASGQSYEISFTNLRWKRVQEARMPSQVREL